MATSSVKIRVSGEDTCRRPLMLPADMTNDRWSFAFKGLQVWRRDPSEADTGVSLRRRVTNSSGLSHGVGQGRTISDP